MKLRKSNGVSLKILGWVQAPSRGLDEGVGDMKVGEDR